MPLLRPQLALLLALLLSSQLSAAPPATGRAAVFYFGQAGADHARQSAKAAAVAAKRWLKVQGSTTELRRAGAVDARNIVPAASDKEIELTFTSVAREAGESDPAAFAPSLEAAAQALAHTSGIRLLVAIVESPPASTELDNAIQPIIEFCQANQIRVLVLDPAEGGAKDSNPALVNLAKYTGGLLIRTPKSLDQSIVALSTAAAPAPAPVEAGNPLTSTASPNDLSVAIRFIRSSSQGLQSSGTELGTPTGGIGGITQGEGGPNINNAIGPMRGVLLVESPLSGLKFETSQSTNTYLARVRITQIARNSKGAVAWRASKELTIRGPLNNLDTRRSGCLFYMRQLQLPGSQYTIEATVEDLLAGKSGSIQERVQPDQGLAGFYVSDAVFVRPFQGKSDRFEADSIFAYDGNALSPILNPVFQTGSPVDLNLYFILYPDINGPPPDISLELLSNGRVVGRAALPFTDSLRDTTREGIGASKGEQKRQFPYLATLRGAQLGPGEFEARLTIRQSRNVLVRSVPFRVLGRGEQMTVLVSGPSAPPSTAQPEDDTSTFVMPEVDPVRLRTTGPQLDPAELDRLWEEAAVAARGYSSNLPNFRCLRQTRQLTASLRSPDQLREGDILVDELTYENSAETYQRLLINGLKADKRTSASTTGVRSSGEFGSMLKALFSPEVAAAYKWAGYAMAGGSMCRVFSVEVEPKKSNFVLSLNGRQEVAGYSGRLFLDEETGLVRRLTIQGAGLPKNFLLQSPTFSLEYGLVRVGPQDFLLPLRSVLQVRKGKSLVRNETVFRNYRKFEASSQIRF